MAQFEDRERGFEAKFAHENEREFRARARRDKLLGLWAADKMGLSGEGADGYARSVIALTVANADEEHIFLRLRQDFDSKAVAVSDHQIRRVMDEFLTVARRQILAE
ncbi:DUF1476 domain-containing protein [Govanella unica]|uniref:DUF1476 domain-containing protein n=1 Tax=Govanella unica TaxID=2975056 RepID=A0A9X3TYE2_9PROT|nr:DUF1476 domain-containing protein [Govania unica]MDA5194068.1 DUF1476 domain-containing protein [Govania unica]